MAGELHVVTGAFGYTGRWIAHRLLNQGKQVRTLTNAVGRDDPFEGRVEVHPLDFDDTSALVESLRGADVLYNTYWVRYNEHSNHSGHEIATVNCEKLFEAAKQAGVRRIVHFSVANPDNAPNWSYFQGKVISEKMLMSCGVSYAIVRPTVLFGGGRNVLVNNIGWILRRFPVFGLFGWGEYLIQPVHVEDVARIAVDVGKEDGDFIVDVTGPETFTYREFVELIAKSMGIRRLILPMPALVGWMAGRAMGAFLRDVVITRAEIRGLMQGLMSSQEAPLGELLFSEWVSRKGPDLGRDYQNDLRERKYNT